MQNRQHKLENSARLLLDAFGKLEAPGLEQTPRRFAKVFLDPETEEDPKVILKQGIIEGREYSGMVVVNGLSFYSLCEHHLLPFFGTGTIAYIPGKKGRLAGLSKFPRVLRCIANGPNIQEAITEKVADVIQEVLEPSAVGVVLSATHLCVAMRGVRIEDSKTVTSVLRGMFLEPGSAARAEFLNLRRRDG